MKVNEAICLNLNSFQFEEYYFATLEYFGSMVKDSMIVPKFLRKRKNLAKILEDNCKDAKKRKLCIYSNGKIFDSFYIFID